MNQKRTAALWLLLLGVSLLARWPEVSFVGAHGDEQVFLKAFDELAHGRSPYWAPLFNYPPPFAILGGRLWLWLGERNFLLALRALELVGACVVAWLALRLTRWPPAMRFVLAAAIVCFSSPIGAAIGSGNVAPLIQGMALGALALAPAAPVVAGVLLGVSVALKPLAAALIPLLFFVTDGSEAAARPWPRRASIAAAATAATFLAVFGWRYAGGLWMLSNVPAPSEHDLSLLRILRSFGLSLSAGVSFALVCAVAAFYLWRRRPPVEGALAVVVTASVFSLPIVWPHTLAITFPIQALALDTALARGEVRTGWQRYLPLLALAAVASIEGSSGSGGAPAEWPAAAKGLVAVIPMAALLGLCILAVRGSRRSERAT